MNREFEKGFARFRGIDNIREYAKGLLLFSDIENMRYYILVTKAKCGHSPERREGAFADSFPKCEDGISLPNHCATVLLNNVGEWLWKKAMTSIDKCAVEQFGYFFDFSTGFSFVLGGILAGEEVLRGQEGENSIFSKEFRQNALKSLIKDNTGKTLIRELTDNLNSDSLANIAIRSHDCVCIPYALDGAKMAGDFYEKLYAKLEPIRQAQKKNKYSRIM